MPKVGEHLNPVIENNFKYHSPKEGQQEKYGAIREMAKKLAYLIDEECPNSREKSVAMTNLETAVMWANASIARN
ncbi:Acb2/Tad1 domain-containing protein [Lysinibacillus xylanilyticus]|uniref:Acb2/Tad1 domain-containing protein n=1 Tax=Lysinibacillus xylanilyticus TaxID=582475 RepID=UPI0038266A1A